MKALINLTLFFMISLPLFGQEYSIVDRRAIRYYKEAEELYQKRRIDEAVNKYRDAFERSADFLEAYIKMSKILFAKGEAKQALEIAQKGQRRIKKGHPFYAEFEDLIARIYLKSGDFEKALSLKSSLEASAQEKGTADRSSILEQLAFIEGKMDKPLSIKKERLPPPLNQFKLQYFPVLTADSKKILFTKRDGLNNYDQEDIYVSDLEEDGWTEPQSIASSINTKYNEGTCTISADGKILIFTSCDSPDSFGSCDLYITYKIEDVWQKPANMGKSVNSRYWDSHPSLSADGSILFFSSNRKDGYGGNDIWYSVRKENGKWSDAQNLGPVINTDRDEVSPFIYFNNEILFFASEGHMGFGGKDLFYTRLAGGEFSEPINLGYPINDQNDQLALFITAQEDYAYYTENSYLEGKQDSSFLYRFPFPKDIHLGDKLIVTEGKVFSKKDGRPVEASLSLVSLSNDSTLYRFRSDGETGAFLMIFPDKPFSGLYVEKEGFVPQIFNVDKDSLKNVKNLEIEMSPVASGEQFIFENVFFDFDKYELKPASYSSLSRLRNFLADNPAITILIVGHTDNVGAKSYNEKLSEKRAESVKEFLTESGIEEDRLEILGMGEKQPIQSNDNEEGRAFNRRIEIWIQ